MKHAKNSLACALVFAGCVVRGVAADIVLPPFTPPSGVARPMAAFDDKSSVVRDPFFPKSMRAPYYTAPTVVQGPKAPQAATPLVLKGILGNDGKRLALINNQTLAEGEAASVKSGNSYVRIRCLKIGERTVTISLESNNEQKELRLQDK